MSVNFVPSLGSAMISTVSMIVGILITLIWHFWVRSLWRRKTESIHGKFLDQITVRKSVEENLRRTLAMFS